MIRNETARLLRRTAPALATLPLALALSGCGTLTGLNAENDFSCPMTPGVSCRSLSDTYYMRVEVLQEKDYKSV